MRIVSDSIRKFLSSHSDPAMLNSEIDLNKLVLRYRETKESADFALICNKTLGVITSQAKKFSNPEFTDVDAFSHGIEILNRAIEKWDPYRKIKNNLAKEDGKIQVSFITFLTRAIHNDFYTFALNSSLYRSYLYKTENSKKKSKRKSKLFRPANGEESLDEFLETLGNNAYDHLPKLTFNSDIDLQRIKSLFDKGSLSHTIIEVLLTRNITRKCDLANYLDIPKETLTTELKYIKRTLKPVLLV